MSTFANAQAITVGYWSIRGLAAPLRMMVTLSDKIIDNITFLLQ